MEGKRAKTRVGLKWAPSRLQAVNSIAKARKGGPFCTRLMEKPKSPGGREDGLA